MKVTIEGKFGKVCVESEPKNLYDINSKPKIVGDDAVYRAINAYEALEKLHEEKITGSI